MVSIVGAKPSNQSFSIRATVAAANLSCDGCSDKALVSLIFFITYILWSAKKIGHDLASQILWRADLAEP